MVHSLLIRLNQSSACNTRPPPEESFSSSHCAELHFYLNESKLFGSVETAETFAMTRRLNIAGQVCTLPHL